MPRRFLAIFAIAAGLLLAAPVMSIDAAAQSRICGSRNHVVKLLEGQFNETQTALGLVSNKGIMELFTSGTGSWTIVFSDTRGVTCVIAAGEAWQQVPLASLDPEA